MMNDVAMLPVVSAIYPISIGATAPPTMVIMSSDEAILVWVPASLNAKEKMVGNMMLSPKYKAKKAASDTKPFQVTMTRVENMVSMAHTINIYLGLI